jgi:hypothetical protein
MQSESGIFYILLLFGVYSLCNVIRTRNVHVIEFTDAYITIIFVASAVPWILLLGYGSDCVFLVVSRVMLIARWTGCGRRRLRSSSRSCT